MEELFVSVLNRSLTASYVIAAVMLARILLKKAPKAISYALWAVVGFRLAFFFSFESVFSLIPFKSAPIPADIAMQPVPRVDSGIRVVDNAVSSVLPAATPTASVNPMQLWLAAGMCLWLAGIAVMLVYSLVSVTLLKRRLDGAEPVGDGIYQAGNLKTPFVFGVFRPKIYIPAGLTGEETRYIILHEQTHIRRHDHVVKFLAYFILCLHWFNPLAWAAFLLMSADMEMSCDERVLKELGGETKRAYSMSLLSLAAERRIIGGSPLAFGEGGMKERIKNVLNFKKPSRVIITAAVVLVAVLSVGFAMDRTVGGRAAEITLDQVRELAKKGDALTMEDFKAFKGVDTGSTPGYHITEYGVEGGYRLIVETGGEGLDRVNIESIWLSSAGVVDIRYNDVDQFVKTHPSAAGGIMEDPEKIMADVKTEFLEGGDPAYALGINKNGLPVFVNPGAALEAARRNYARAFAAVSEKFNLGPVDADNCSLYKKYGWQQPFEDLRYQGIQTSKFFDIYENSFGDVKDADRFIKLPPMAAGQWELIRKADVNRDGREEGIYLDKSQRDRGFVTLGVYDGNGNGIWSEQASTSHVGWTSLFLCRQDGETYLLRYLPGMWQGYCTYTYSLFTLEGGSEHVVRSNSIEFDINGVNKLDAPKMIAFAEEVNALLGKSTLLLSSEGGKYSFGPAPADQLFERYSWLDDTPGLYADGDDLKTRLVKYSEYVVSNRR